jgi:CheY-like chemotaxis protein
MPVAACRGFPDNKYSAAPTFGSLARPIMIFRYSSEFPTEGRRGQPGNVERLSMKHRLLIADRDAELCEFYRRFLADMGYDAETCTDGLDCLAKLRRATPAVLVLDLELLWGGGDGVLAWLREESRAPGIPVLLTANALDRQDMAEFSGPPVVDYLPKPYTLASLFEKIRSAVANKGRRDPSGQNSVPSYPRFFVE